MIVWLHKYIMDIISSEDTWCEREYISERYLQMDRSGKCYHERAPSTGFQRSRWDCLVEWIQEGLSKFMDSSCGVAGPEEVNNELNPKLPLRYLVLKQIETWGNCLCLSGGWEKVLFPTFFFLCDDVSFCIIALPFSWGMMNIMKTDQPFIFTYLETWEKTDSKIKG